ENCSTKYQIKFSELENAFDWSSKIFTEHYSSKRDCDLSLIDSYVDGVIFEPNVLSDSHFSGPTYCDPVIKINEELRILKAQLKQHPDRELLSRVRVLILELHGFLRKKLNASKRSLRVFLQGKIVYVFIADLRKHIRLLTTFLFKCMNDFSGCEEEEFSILTKGRNNFFSTQLNLKCFINTRFLKTSIVFLKL
ncbi:MAG TPA: hypothetical protein VK787_11270, partial [Puia sp.]|nr:hypothetical protein [Puia sp.]